MFITRCIICSKTLFSSLSYPSLASIQICLSRKTSLTLMHLHLQSEKMYWNHQLLSRLFFLFLSKHLNAELLLSSITSDFVFTERWWPASLWTRVSVVNPSGGAPVISPGCHTHLKSVSCCYTGTVCFISCSTCGTKLLFVSSRTKKNEILTTLFVLLFKKTKCIVKYCVVVW